MYSSSTDDDHDKNQVIEKLDDSTVNTESNEEKGSLFLSGSKMLLGLIFS